MNDTISDLLTRIRNGQMSNKEKVSIPYSKMKEALCKVMLDEGYINDINIEENEYKNIIVDLKYYDDKPVIDYIQRVSRPGLRIYKASNDIPLVKKWSWHMHSFNISRSNDRQGCKREKMWRRDYLLYLLKICQR
jgi:small subunit ribosomal protein S8